MHLVSVTIVLLTLQVTCRLVHADTNCTGEKEYLDSKDGECKQCEKCPPGQQPNKHCGYGEIHNGYKCETCPPNRFSSSNDYNLCIVCRDCKSLNANTASQCTGQSNSVCGTCFSGYFKPTKSDGTMDDECHLCTDATKNNVQCQHSLGVQWRTWLFIALAVVGVLILVIIVLVCITCKKGFCYVCPRNSATTNKTHDQSNASSHSGLDEQTSHAQTALLSNKDEAVCMPGIFLLRSRCHGSESEDESENVEPHVPVIPDTDAENNIGETSLAKSLLTPEASMQQFQVQSEVPLKEAVDMRIQFPEHTTNVTEYPHSNYSDQPTAEYNDPAIENAPTMPYNENNSHLPPCYSNLPTCPFDEDISGTSRNQNSNSETQSMQDSGNHSYRRRGVSVSGRRRRQQLDMTSSNESLLEHVDRDSKRFGGQRPSPITIDFAATPVTVEFFETSSIETENTKPHTIGTYTPVPCFTSHSQPQSTASPTVRPISPTSCNAQCRPMNFTPNVICQPQANIVRPRPAIPASAPHSSFLPPPNTRSNSLRNQSAREPCNMNKSLSSSEAILSSHTTNIQKIKERFEEACSRVKDQPLDNLDSNLADRITLKLTDRPEGTGEAYPTIKTWRHIANCFKVESVTVDNSRSLSDILRYLRAHRRHTILDLLNAVNHIQRYDVLSDICNHILGLNTENSLNHFEERVPSMLTTQA